MDTDRAKEIVKSLADGIDPILRDRPSVGAGGWA
jgi:hypothetical protein